MIRSYLGLGGNQRDVFAAMVAALDELDRVDGVRVSSVSRVSETAPVGAHAGDAYLNAAVEIETELSPIELLDQLQRIERSLGRQASARWAGRPIDLDLLLFDRQVIDSPRLTVPHPQMWYRRFVLDPLAEIAGEVVHPVYGLSITRMQSDLRQRPLRLVVAGGCAEDRLAVGSLLRGEGIEVVAPDTLEATSLRLRYVGEESEESLAVREVDLATLPGSLVEAARSFLTAILDEPQVHSRPLRRIP